eukprot:CAMPEP_0182847736 /NCGR_PEP_ID=MMETSP0006_2-20121128/28621_1 /TAXON_ID=97485 /ORGANISM="Prymnesium parvum, Strain Texoma1" /LENGTH=740 /DNA_ID=CAMNT_0024978097 /DNA_START=384 /DNA_END=2606 /DNA_ORIENTATION=-
MKEDDEVECSTIPSAPDRAPSTLDNELGEAGTLDSREVTPVEQQGASPTRRSLGVTRNPSACWGMGGVMSQGSSRVLTRFLAPNDGRRVSLRERSRREEIVEHTLGTSSRGTRRTVQSTRLNIGRGGRKDRRLKEEDFLTEMLSPQDIKHVLLPFGRIRIMWDLVMFILVAYTAIVLPVQIAFSTENHFPDALRDFEYAVDFIFLTDIVLNFRTAYVENAELVVDLNMIRSRYMRFWFPVDLAGSFPLDLVLQASSGSAGNTQFVTLIKVLKVPKLLRIGRFLKKLEKVEGAANIGGIFVLCMIMVVLVHWLACVWFIITASTGPGGWLATKGLDELVWTDQYAAVFYSTLMMVMGDSINISQDLELVFASTVVIIGACINATIFASVANYIVQLSAVSVEHKSKMTWINRTLASLKISKTGLDTRIAQYAEYCWVRHRDFAAHQLVKKLPSVFSSSLAVQVYGDMLRAFPIFANVDDHFLANMATKLKPEVYQPEEYILVRGQIWQSVYFIKRGKVQVTWAADRPSYVNVVEHENYFGELGLFLTSKLNYTVRAMTHLDCFRLDRLDFESVMRTHPAGSLHVADAIKDVLPAKLAPKVVASIYEASDIRKVLKLLQNRRWRPPKGFAARLKAYGEARKAPVSRLRGPRRSIHDARSKRPSHTLDSSLLVACNRSVSDGTALIQKTARKSIENVESQIANLASAQSALQGKMMVMKGELENQMKELNEQVTYLIEDRLNV